ncbi:MAG TPA: FAD-dependent oxidoreductase [Polyangiaceae bacterium]|nr:FAD-dependent oxidoreductase [Polyangiaceae bacterium]
MSNSSTPVAILGAGLTGMSTAFHLASSGCPYRLFERGQRAGGLCTTIEERGFRFDRTGHLLHLRDEAMRKLVLRWVGDDHVTVQRRSVIWSHGVYSRYPYQANTFGLPPQIAYECLMGFLRARETPPAREPTNFEEFCYANFGDGFSKHFMIPYNSRLWGVHPREITAAWCSRFVPLPKLEDVIAGAVGLNDRELGYNTAFVYPRLGIGTLAESMARDVPGIELERAASRIDLHARQVHFDDGEIVSWDALVSTLPLDRLCALVSDLPDDIRTAASRLRCNPLWYLDVALDVPCGQPFHWVYVPEEKYPFYRVGCYSHFSAALAPEGKSCLYVELADRREPDLLTLLPDVAAALVEMQFIQRPDQILFARKRRIDYAYVVFDHDYFESVATVQSFLRDHHVLSTGRYGGWNYSSMEDALLFGRDAARETLEIAR